MRARERKREGLGGLIDKGGGPTVEQAPTVVGGRQLASPARLGVRRHITPQVGVCFDLDNEEQGPVCQIQPSSFDGGEEGGDGGARSYSKVLGYGSYREATITYNVDMDGVWGIDPVFEVD